MFIGRSLKTLATAAVVAGLSFSAARANDFAPQIEGVMANQIRPWLSDPVVVEAVRRHNIETAGLSDAGIEALDRQWRGEVASGGGPLIDRVLGNPLSAFLKARKAASNDLYAEIFVMDSRGLNVGQSDVTSDYMQGDEEKWRRTFLSGPEAVFIDQVEFDSSSGQFQSQLNATIADPATGLAIGAITVGIHVEKLN